MKRGNWILVSLVPLFAGIAFNLDVSNAQSPTGAQTLTEKLVSEDPTQLAKEARRDGDIVRGAILFHQGNINCAKCHRPTAEKDRIGPDLRRLDRDTSDTSIIESILQPSKQIKEGYKTFVLLTSDGRTVSGIKVSEDDDKIVIRDSDDVDSLIVIARHNLDAIRSGKVSSMPKDLANQLKNRQQFLDLLRYVFDVVERGPEVNSRAYENVPRRELSPALHGLVLIQKRNCSACHTLDSIPSPITSPQAPRLKWSAARLNPDYIQKFVANPHEIKPGSTMPALLGHLDRPKRKATATAITHYLLAATENKFVPQRTDPKAVRRGFELFHSVGCVACHAPRDQAGVEQGLEREPSITLGDLFPKYNIEGLTRFLEQPLLVRPSGHMPNMQLTHREAIDISNFLLQAQAMPQTVTSWKVDPQLAKQGETLFSQHRCASCHTDFSSSAASTSEKWEVTKLDPTRGCLSKQEGDWPNFHLQDPDRAAIRAALEQPTKSLNDEQKIDVTLASLNCIACHNRADFGGVSPDRNSYFQTTNLNLGDQGRIPPTLTGVGAKLKRKWMRDVMVNGRSIRPYMQTRMPQFGEENVQHLFALFETNDQLGDTEFAEFEDQKAMREQGHLLAGNKGLNCVACHTYQYKPSDTMPAVDLTEMTERLKKDWFYQYMLAPQKFSPNTVMPSFWPGGQAIRSDLEGRPKDQIEALWQYLIDGRQARAPRGVVREPLEIVATDEARMLRRSYPGIGKRGIGVGYPGGVNIAYDAEQLRLGAIWRGKFAEASGVWRGQGSGTVRPLGRPIEFAKGPELDFSVTPWVVDDGRPPNHRFQGYVLDKTQRPTFRYSFDSVEVEDFFSQVADDQTGTIKLERRVTMSSKEQRDDLRFRVAAAERITATDGMYSVDEKISIRIISAHAAQLADLENGQNLQVPITIEPGGKVQLVIEYFWD
jgi:putative heme-binding domain-containing protein